MISIQFGFRDVIVLCHAEIYFCAGPEIDAASKVAFEHGCPPVGESEAEIDREDAKPRDHDGIFEDAARAAELTDDEVGTVAVCHGQIEVFDDVEAEG